MPNSPIRALTSMYIISAIIIIALVIDFYVYQGLKITAQDLTLNKKKLLDYLYWGVTCFTLGTLLIYTSWGLELQNKFLRRFFLPFSFVNYIAKLFAVLFLLLDDVLRAFRWVMQYVTYKVTATTVPASTGISRSMFLSQVAMAAVAVPVITMSYGIISGAHDYRVRRIKVRLPHLPKAFHGLRIGQLSDIHTGSFFNKTAVKGGVAMLLGEKPDIVFFTGDLVNNKADEVNDYVAVFNKVKAPLGVYSVLGNHDYGDYINWSSPSVKKQNLLALCQAHKQLGWHLLINTHKIIVEGNDQLAIIGVENWGTGSFSKYGQLQQAYRGTEGIPVKLLLSHDPSHWDAQVRAHCPDIDLTFSGHTHGFQFGIEIGSFKWSPAQYRYKQWAGLHQEGSQYLYVNRGYGYIGYPGRIGILPEITIMELERG